MLSFESPFPVVPRLYLFKTLRDALPVTRGNLHGEAVVSQVFEARSVPKMWLSPFSFFSERLQIVTRADYGQTSLSLRGLPGHEADEEAANVRAGVLDALKNHAIGTLALRRPCFGWAFREVRAYMVGRLPHLVDGTVLGHLAHPTCQVRHVGYFAKEAYDGVLV